MSAIFDLCAVLEAGEVESSRLEEFRRDWETSHYEQVKAEPELWEPGRHVRNLIVTREYRLVLLSILYLEADLPKIEAAIRYFIDAASSDAVVAETLRQPELWVNECLSIRVPPHKKDWMWLMRKVLQRTREVHLSDRPAGPRGTVADCASVPAEKTKFVDNLVEKFRAAKGKLRAEIALSLGEMGGDTGAEVLRAALLDEPHEDRKFKLSVISALANLGGPLAVDTLLQVAESNPEKVGAAALSSLEFLSLGGSTALTEAPEPPKIDSPELRKAYENLTERLYQLSRSHRADEYVRHKADQLRQDILPALRGVSADVA